MIRQLAQCPYCKHCKIALDDNPQLVFNPTEAAQVPCSHLAWVDGRYSQWDLSPQGINSMIGSTEFRWDPPEPGAEDRTEQLLSYLHELMESGVKWAFAPSEKFAIEPMNAEEKYTDPKKGKVYTRWDVDGAAIFAENPGAFWDALTACQDRQLEALKVKEEGDS